MLEQLEQIQKRYQELEMLLASPEVTSDAGRYQKYAKEFAGFREIVQRYQEYQRLCQEIQDLEKILSRRDQEPDLACIAESELQQVSQRKQACENQLEQMILEEESDVESNKDVIVEIRAGTGGLEASLFAADLFRMYSRYAATQNWQVEMMNTHSTEAGGFKEVIFSISGKGVYRKLKYESGVHRVQRVPLTEASGRIHTSTTTVAVLAEAEEVEVQIKSEDLRIDVFRSSGPGGQGVNTTDSAVRITHLPTGLVVTCQDERSQLKNKNKALRVLRARLLDQVKQVQQQKTQRDRRSQIGSGERSEKIRTYNFPDRRVTDHRVGFTVHRLPEILEGDLEEIIQALIKAEKDLKLGRSALK